MGYNGSKCMEIAFTPKISYRPPKNTAEIYPVISKMDRRGQTEGRKWYNIPSTSFFCALCKEYKTASFLLISDPENIRLGPAYSCPTVTKRRLENRKYFAKIVKNFKVCMKCWLISAYILTCVEKIANLVMLSLRVFEPRDFLTAEFMSRN
jgi:hypothetical protein